MVKKCDVKGCKQKAVIFTKSLAFCKAHWKQIIDEYWKRGITKVKEVDCL